MIQLQDHAAQGQPLVVGVGDGTMTVAVKLVAGSTAPAAPSISAAGSISPASGQVGTVFTLTPPTAGGNPVPTVMLTSLTQNGVDILGQVTGGQFTSTATGPLVATWTASNGVNPAATSTANATITAASVAPSITAAGSISPASGPVGTVFTLAPPTAAGNPAPTVTLTSLTQNGVDVLGQVAGGQFTSTATGPLVATWTASNGVNPAATSTANATITAASVAPSITAAGAISPASGPVGTVFTLTQPTASGSPTPTITLTALTQNGVNVLGQVTGGQFTSTATGPLVATWTASNGVNPAATSTANATITAASVAPSITAAGTISPASGTVGTVFTLTPPTADGNPVPTVTLTSLTQNGVDALGQVAGGQFTSTATGPLVATWTASNGVNPAATSTANATVLPVLSLALTDFGTDKGLYGSAAHLGRNYGIVPAAGTGTDGEIVQVRALSVDDGGATSTAWIDVATIAGGVWSGLVNVPRSASWYKLEARMKSQPAVSRQSTNRFGVGHVVAIWGQSEPNFITQSSYSQTANFNVSDSEALQVFYFSGTMGSGLTPTRAFINNTTPVTSALTAMAETLIAARPGEKFAFIFQTVPGTSFTSLVNDSDPARNWSDALALHDLATSGGRDVDVAAASWFSSPAGFGASYADAFLSLVARKNTTGTAMTIPGTVTNATGNFQADHWFGELYNYNVTRWLAYGPHRFDPQVDLSNAVTQVVGGSYTSGQNREGCRTSWAALPGNANASGYFLNTLGYSPMTYLNGWTPDNTAANWTDIIHPSKNSVDGMPMFARHNALAILQGMGVQAFTVPKFDNCYWEPGGAYVEVWSSTGAITTPRKARSIAALPATYPHWTEVAGFEINAIPVTSALIQANGRVRITKPGGGNFVSSDVLTFGRGEASGGMKYQDDNFNGFWMNYPIVVQAGAPTIDGVPVQPLPSAAVLANTIVPVNPYFTTVSAQQTRFKDTANWPTAGGKFTAALDLAITSFAATSYVLEMDNTHVTCNVATDGRMFLSVKDSAGTSLLSSVQIGTVAVNTRFTLVIAIDLAANTCITTLNGTATTRTLPANSGNLASTTRKIGFLARSSGTTGNTIAQVYQLEVWNDFVAGGGKPTDTLLRTNGRITGTPTTVNAHPWKAGGDVV